MRMYLNFYSKFGYIRIIFVSLWHNHRSLFSNHYITVIMESTNNVFNFPFGTIVLLPTMGQEALGVAFDMRWMLVGLMFLMIIDTFYSYAEHVMNEHQGKKVDPWTTSSCLRRFGGKIGTYLSFLVIGCFIGLAITEPLGSVSHIYTSAVGALLGFACEIFSIGGHYLHLKGIYVTLSPAKFIRSIIVAYVKSKSEEVGAVVEEELIIENK